MKTGHVVEQIESARRRIAASAEAVGRSPDAVTLVAVTKRQPIEYLFEAYDAGVHDFAESTAQALTAKAAALQYTGRDPRWHFIGRLQRNKVNQVLSCASVVQTVDRPDLAEALSQRAPEAGVDVLVQVNVGREPQKGGSEPDNAVSLAREVATRPRLRLKGLMAIPPYDSDAKAHFVQLAELLRALRATPEGQGATELSMGMSDDFEEAIRCGATMVRLGTSLFGERLPKV